MNILKNIIKAAITKRKAVYLMVIIIFIMAFLQYGRTTKSLLPSAKFPYVSVYTYMSGASPSNMESEVTDKIEQTLNDLSDLSLMTSTSSYSSSLVILKFNEGTDIDDKIRVVQTKISNMKHGLPKKAETPVVEEYDINDSPIIMIELDNRLPFEDKENIIKDVERHVKGIAGVSKIKVSGLENRVIEIIPNEVLLDQYGISEIEMVEKLKSFQTSLPLGSTVISGNTYNFQITSELESVEDIENTIVKYIGGKPVYMRDVCDVKYKSKMFTSSYRIVEGEKSSTVILSVFKKKSGDTVSINDGIKNFVKDYNASNDYGVELGISVDVSKYISKSIGDVFNNALSGLLSVVVVLFFFIGIREAMIASSVIPVTLVSSFLLFKSFDITLNIFSIMGLIIALGMLVDNAIVVIEMIDEKKKENKHLTMKEIVIESTSRVAPAILASTVTTICALVPLAIMKGDTGSLIREIPLTASIAMGISFLSSITITPVLAVQFIKHETKNKFKIITLIFVTICAAFALSDNFHLTFLSFVAAAVVLLSGYFKLFTSKTLKIFDWFSDFIKKLMHSKLKKAAVMVITVILLLTSVSLLFSDFIKKEAMPEGDDINQFATIQLIKGSTKSDAEMIASKINAHMLASGHIEKINYTLDASSISYMLELVHKDHRAVHSKDIIRDFNRFILDMPDVKGRFSADGESEGGPISLRLLGRNRDQLNSAGEMVVETLRNIEDVVNPRVKFNYSQPTFDITINKNQCSVYGVTPMDVMLKLRYLTTGEEVVSIDRNGEKTKVYLEYHQPFEAVDELEHVMVQNNMGRYIPVIELVDIQETRFESNLEHYENKNAITIIADKSSQGNTNIIMNTLIERIEDKLPDGVSYKKAGEAEEMSKSFKDLAEKMVIAGVLVYIVLVVQFNSYSQPFAIVLSIPYAIIGVVLGYGVFGLTFSTLSFLGIVALVGIAVNDAIVLIDYINMLRVEEKMTKIESIIEGAKSRFNPIIATSLTTIAGVLPLALYNEDYSGVAYSLIFGLIFSTVLTLVVVPITLNIIESVIDRLSKGVSHE